MNTPWEVVPIKSCYEGVFQVLDAEGFIVCDNLPYEACEVTEEEQRHIVACVNACAGIKPEVVPEMVAVLRGVVASIGNVDHATKSGPNDALMRGEKLNCLRDILLELLAKAQDKH